jgi:hypothetical protein
MNKSTKSTDSILISATAVEGVVDVRMLRPTMMVVTTNIEGGPKPENSVEEENEESAKEQRGKIKKIYEDIWNLEASRNLKWLFITDDDINLKDGNWKRKLLWQLFCRFDVARDIHFDNNKERVAWDATAPIPSQNGPFPVRRWPAVTLHNIETTKKVEKIMKEFGY